MLGAIIGDIVGSRFEFNPTNEYNFELFTEDCSFTDDTVCTIAVADALLKGRDFGESIHEWCRKYPNPMGGYGGRFREWVMSDNPQPYGSYGNGSAMRVSPIGWWCDPHDVMDEAKKSAECTHNHPEGINGAEAVAIAICESLEMMRSLNGKELTRDHLLWSGLHHAVNLYEEFPQHFKVDLEKCRNKFDETCQGTVPVALWIILNSTGFEDALRKAVSLGGDADTLGAIVGGIAEAIWGIPEWMKKKAMPYLPEEMKKVVYDFRTALHHRRKASAEKEAFDQMQAIMLWKLGLGNMAKFFNGENYMPSKEKIATRESWKIETWPENCNDWSICEVDIPIPASAMEILLKGHIPEVQEDHWFMFMDDENIRYYRSWTGMPAFEAHYRECADGYHIDSVKMNKALCEFGVNGNIAGIALFNYLIAAEVGGDSTRAWEDYLSAWEYLHDKYKK